MFYYQDPQCRKFENDSPNSRIFVNSKEIQVNKKVCLRISTKLKNIFSKREDPSNEERTFYIEKLSNFNDMNVI